MEWKQGARLPAHALPGGHESQREGEYLSEIEYSLTKRELRLVEGWMPPEASNINASSILNSHSSTTSTPPGFALIIANNIRYRLVIASINFVFLIWLSHTARLERMAIKDEQKSASRHVEKQEV